MADAKTEILLAVETNRSRAPQLNNEHLLNFMVERQPAEAKGQTPLFGCPGITFLSSLGTPPSRGAITLQDRALFVQGDQFWEVKANGKQAIYGTGIGGSQLVSIASSGTQLVIVNGAKGWTFDFTNGLQQITDGAFRAAQTVCFFDDYFIFPARGTRQWFISQLLDGRTYDALDFATAEGGTGNCISVQENLQLIFIFCEDHIEIWYDAGTADFPFQRYTGGIIPYGTVSPYAIVKIDGALWFMGVDKIFYRLQANVPIRVSTHAIETLIAAEPDLSAVEAYCLTVEGHKLIFVTLPFNEITVCYDISTGKWHERDSVDENFISLGRYRGRTTVDAYGKTLMGDAFDGRIGTLSWDVFKEYDKPMRGQIDTITQHGNRNRLFCDELELDMEFGVGLTTGQGSVPLIMAQRTVDGGKTFGKQVQPRSMGKQGEFKRRVRWKRQGQGRQMGWRFTITDPVRWTIIAAFAQFTPGDA